MSCVTTDDLLPVATNRVQHVRTPTGVEFWFAAAFGADGRKNGWTVLTEARSLGHAKTLKEAAWRINAYLRSRGEVVTNG